MSPSLVGALLEKIASVWRLEGDCEISLEANPTSVEAERLRGFRAAGVNRVSMGIQSLNDQDLKRLGRLHTAQEALKSFDIAQNAGPSIAQYGQFLSNKQYAIGLRQYLTQHGC